MTVLFGVDGENGARHSLLIVEELRRKTGDLPATAAALGIARQTLHDVRRLRITGDEFKVRRRDRPGRRLRCAQSRTPTQSPINAISMPAEAAAAVSTRATARVRKYGPWRRQLEGSSGRDPRSCTRCALGSSPGGRAMGAFRSLRDHPPYARGRARTNCQT